MPKKTYIEINSITLAAAASSVTFTSIPQNFRDLVLVCTGTTSNTGINSIIIRFNSDSGSNYPLITMNGTGSGTNSAFATNNGALAGLAISSSVNANIAHILDYSATNKHKTVLSRGNSLGGSYIRASSTRWANTAVIQSIICLIDTGANFNSGSTFFLYGIEA
jgi:hypothetical protein